MAKLPILTYPNPFLRKKTAPVTVFDATLQTLIDNMFETMYADNGAGLAATQIGYDKNVIVIDVSENRKNPLVLINAEILDRQGTTHIKEGCLSFPELFVEVKRSKEIQVKAQDREGKELSFHAEDFLSICVQHEMDHNNGIVFIDRLSSLKRNLAIKKLEKLKRWQSGTVL